MKNSYLFVRKLFTVTALMAVFLFASQHAYADTSESSANLAGSASGSVILPVKPIQKEDRRVTVLRAFLDAHNSPLSTYSDIFVSEADKYQIDWKLLPAISGVESTFGLAIPVGSFNGWGFGIYGSNCRRFTSWHEAIATISQAIREDYMNKWGAKDVYSIGRIYAADPFWSGKVVNYMNQIDSSDSTMPQQNQALPISF